MEYIGKYEKVLPQDYIDLRVKSGLSSKSMEAAIIGLSNSLCCVAIYHIETNKIVGMGRVVGDGACHCQVVDICVLPEHQGQGLGKLIMSMIDSFVKNNLPDSCYVNLIADGEAFRLYEKYGFKEVWPASRGMGYVKKN
ncbi:GNAT family N-acetyltransferase [Myroides injenensis]|uniref:GNAT family N-acetyltransferase n=1 Tax=Myroides injenensis TaxID=1183151 RepID=UPI000289EA04|nr:GNAT family N-acetyltransferase [Myroides injenensis]